MWMISTFSRIPFEGIRNILKNLTQQAQKEDIIINLKKSALYLDKQQQKQEGLIAQIKSCKTLQHLLIKHKGSYLGAETRPTKMATYQQIRARSAKAHAAHSEMTIRGFNQQNLGRTTITKILNSIIAPLLTYGLEAFPLKKTDYEPEANALLLKVAVLTLCKNYAEQA